MLHRYNVGDELTIICKALVTVFLSFVRFVVMIKNAASITTNDVCYTYGRFAYNIIIILLIIIIYKSIIGCG